MAGVPFLWCGPCYLERVGGRTGRRSRRLPGKEGLIFPTLPLSVLCELWDLPGSTDMSALALGPHKGPCRMAGTPFTAVTRWELYAMNKLFNWSLNALARMGQGRRMGATFQPSSFPHAKPGEAFLVDQHWAASV